VGFIGPGLQGRTKGMKMALGYAANHVFEIATYTETCGLKGQVCMSPDCKYGDDWRESFDLRVFKGTAQSLIADALETMNRPRVGLHDWNTARNIIEYLDEKAVKHDGKYMLESDVPDDAANDK
jgi:hypothetical protein